jgi:hypothetical protein
MALLLHARLPSAEHLRARARVMVEYGKLVCVKWLDADVVSESEKRECLYPSSCFFFGGQECD